MIEAFNRINRAYAGLTPGEQTVAGFVRHQPEQVALLSLQALADRCGTSDATVLRFCRAIGYSGYQDFKSSLVIGLFKQDHSLVPEDGDNHAYSQRVLKDLQTTLTHMSDTDLTRIACQIARGRYTVVAGVAGSAGVARIFYAGLLALGLHAMCVSDRVEIERMSDLLTKNDVLIGISHSGEAPEVLLALERADAHGALTVAMTNAPSSPVTKAASVTLQTATSERLLGSNACYPRALELLVLELLLDRVAEQL